MRKPGSNLPEGNGDEQDGRHQRDAINDDAECFHMGRIARIASSQSAVRASLFFMIISGVPR